jgi:ABC-type antimicrobial peptide transport system permease subunit
MKPTKSRPPRWATSLLARWGHPGTREEALGDLLELHAHWTETHGLRRANRRYAYNALKLLRPLAQPKRKSEYTPPFFLHPTMLRDQLKTALRNLLRHKGTSLINLAGLTLGVTACLAIYLVTRFELSYDTFHPDRERIYRVVGESRYGAKGETHPVGCIPAPVPAALRAEVPGFETIAAFHNSTSHALIPNGTAKPARFEAKRWSKGVVDLVVAEPQYFEIFKYDWLAGNPKTALSEPFQVVLTERAARTYFGPLSPDRVLGREVMYFDSLRAKVTGVVKDFAQPSDLTFTDFLSFSTIGADAMLKRSIDLDQWNDIWSASQAYVKLPVGATPAQFEKAFQQFAKKHFPGEYKFKPALQPLADLHFDADYVDNYSRKAHLPTLYGLMGVAGFILLIAAINFVNLATAQSTQRAREIGVRKVLGSSRAGLMAQFMSETALLTLAAVLISLLLVGPVLQAVKSLTPPGLNYSLLTGRTLLFLLSVTALTATLAGLYPSWVLSAFPPALTLKGQSALRGGGKGYLRKGLIVFQFTVSLVFIIGTIVVGRQLRFMREKDLGFSTNAILEIPSGRAGKTDLLIEKIKPLAGVERVTKQWFPPMGESYMMTRLKYQGKREVDMDVSVKAGDEQFIPLYDLRLLAGRNYVKSDSLREFVINATYAHALGFRKPADALNQVLEFDGKNYPIVGVVADFHEQSFHERIGATAILNLPQARNVGVKLTTRGKDLGSVKTTLAELERVWKSVHPDLPFEYSFVDDSIARLYEKETKTGQLVNAATAVAILISCLGLFGLATFTAQQRTKEIGIRKVLGASVAGIVALLSADFLKLVLIALAFASPLAWWGLTEWLKDFAYKVDVAWWVFALAGLVAVGIALLTVSFQSVKAALANPVESLRSE